MKLKESKTNFLIQEEITRLKYLIIGYLAFFSITIILQIIAYFTNFIYLNIKQFLLLAGFNIIIFILIIISIISKKLIKEIKYPAVFLMCIGITLFIYLLKNNGSPGFLGYILLLIITGIFYELEFPIITGLLSGISYYSLILYYLLRHIPSNLLKPSDIILKSLFLLSFTITIALISNNYNRLIQTLSKEKNILEESRNHLLELTNELEKTKIRLENKNIELNKRLKDLERFYKLAIGRELRMIELKKQIKELQDKLSEKFK